MEKISEIETKHRESGSNAEPIPNNVGNDTIIKQAAKALGTLPKCLQKGRRKVPRKWTGFVQAVRMWVGRIIILPNGTLGRIKQVRRGLAVVWVYGPDAHAPPVERTFLAASLRVWKNPAAIALGRRKLGKHERKSDKKAEAARRNGRLPARFGSRRRGRHSRDQPVFFRFVLRTRRLLRANMGMKALLRVAIAQRTELDAAVAAAKAKDEAKARRSAQLGVT